MDESLVIYCDGGARGNPGPAACAFVVEEKGKPVFNQSKYLGIATNNFAEYSGVILALKWLARSKKYSGYPIITFFLDSELIAKQLKGIFKIKKENLRFLFYSIKTLEREIRSNVEYIHIGREKNKLADFFVNKCLDEKISRDPRT